MNQASRRSLLGLVFFIAVTSLAGAIGSWWTMKPVRTWYPTIAKPAWTPPAPVFGPVWTVLYLMMAVAAWRVWRAAGGWAGARGPLTLYAIQLVLNAVWSGLFFGLRSPLLGLIDIIPLWGMILATLIAFWRRDRAAGWLFLPYHLWVSFAVVLNAAIWWLNRGG